MIIKKISKICGYKSFKGFDHDRFIDNNYHEKINLFFGENGSGKSSISKILKSICPNNNFEETFPEEICVKLNNGSDIQCSYKNKAWDRRLSDHDILFFDTEFVSKNLHINKERGGGEGEAEQNSAKLIIDFSEHAICLKNLAEESKEKRDNVKKIIKEFKIKNEDTLNFTLNQKDRELMLSLESETPNLKITRIQKILSEESQILEEKQRLLTKNEEIKKIPLINKLEFSIPSILDGYNNLFGFNLKENVKDGISDHIRLKIIKNKLFFEKGMELWNENKIEECPFCNSGDSTENIKKLIESYNAIYDTAYEQQLKNFRGMRIRKLSEIDNCIEQINKINIDPLFLAIKQNEVDFDIKNLYNIEQERALKEKRSGISLLNLISIKENIKNLDLPDGNMREELISECNKELKQINDYIVEVNKLISEKNEVIKLFKMKNTEEKLELEISILKKKIEELEYAEAFWKSNKIDKIKRKELLEEGLDQINAELKEAEDEYKKRKELHEKYCESSVFNDMIEKMMEYFGYFKFDFKLEFNKKSGAHKMTPFSFIVKDQGGIKRSFKEGLSEGETQVLSICFFFAFLDNQSNKHNKIIVFDDPITSLDSGNLDNLARLIKKESEKYSQLFILTHHPIFDKNIRKVFGDKANLGQYSIMKNTEKLGGSFICKRVNKNYIDKLKELPSKIKKESIEGIDPDEIIIKYGQTLRLGIEDVVKNKLLCWGKDFDKIIEGVKSNANINPSDLEKLKELYRFCNISNTSHIDKEEKVSLSELTSKIDEFTGIYDRLFP